MKNPVNKKRILTDPGFWLLAVINLYLVFHYYQDTSIFYTLIWLYWTQSALLGLFTFFDILTVRTVAPGSFAVVYKNNAQRDIRKGPAALIFLAHYGLFHLVYFIGIIVTGPPGEFQSDFYSYFIVAFVVTQVVTFVQHKVQQRHTTTDISSLFLTPYFRIVPMHMAILLPVFFHTATLGIFLILKGIADVVMYIVTKPASGNKDADAALLTSRQFPD